MTRIFRADKKTNKQKKINAISYHLNNFYNLKPSQSSVLIIKLAKVIAQLSFKNLYYEKSRFVLFVVCLFVLDSKVVIKIKKTPKQQF